MHITATHINYLHICHRKLWLFSNGINMEHTSDIVYDGKLLHETSYPQRAERHTEIELSATAPGSNIPLSGKIDFYDAQQKIVHETKRSDKVEEAHEWQVKYYIWLLELSGIEGVHAILEYPKLRRTDEVWLSTIDREYLKETVIKVAALQEQDICPPLLNSKICKSCSYFDFCYSGEEQ